MKIYPENNRFIKEVIRREEYRFLYRYPTVIDIGANVGTFAIWVYDNADKIYAIEPVKENIAYLTKTIERNKLAKISVHELAISDTSITKKLEERGSPDQGGWRISEAGTRPVRCQTLKDFMDEQNVDYADLVKMDVEGYELHILSAKHFPHDRIGTIIGESHEGSKHDVKKMLIYYGYKYQDLSRNHFLARK